MITQMEITYRSENPCNVKPEIFTTGGYIIKNIGNDITFDFEDMTANTRFENGYLYIDALQKNIDYTVSEDIPPEVLDNIFRTVKKEDFIEIFYECFEDQKEQHFINLIPESIVFYDFKESGNMTPIEVTGTSFINENNNKEPYGGGILKGVTVYNYIELKIWTINNILEKAGCLNAKALYKHEEKSENCKFSCIVEDETTPFSITLGNALGIIIKDISWVCDDVVSIVFIKTKTIK